MINWVVWRRYLAEATGPPAAVGHGGLVAGGGGSLAAGRRQVVAGVGGDGCEAGA